MKQTLKIAQSSVAGLS